MSFDSAKFKQGQGGRAKGVKNKLRWAFLTDLLADYEAHGAECIKICRIERPIEYVKLIAALLPKEFEITDSRLNELSDEEIDVLIGEIRARIRSRFIEDTGSGEKPQTSTENTLQYYKPYPKQLEFHNAGAKYRERLLMAANQIGKTLAGGFEAAMHATGRYPDGWKGKRFDRPTNGWACGVTGETVQRYHSARLSWTLRQYRHRRHSKGRHCRDGHRTWHCRPCWTPSRCTTSPAAYRPSA